MDPSVVNIKLMADIADLQSKMQQAKALMNETMKGVAEAVASVSRAANVAMGALGGLGAGLGVAAMVAHARATVDAADAMNDLSQRTGIAVRDLAKYQLATSQSGTTMEALAKGIKGVAGNLLEHGDALKKAGITATTADEAMKQFADVFAQMPDSMEKTNLAVKVFGKSGMDLIPMLNMGSKGLEDAAEKSARYAAQMAAMAPMADAFNDNLAELSMHSKVAGMNMVNSMLPALVSITAAMAEAAKHGGILSGIVAGIQTLFTGDDLHKANVATVKGLEQVMSAEKALESARAAGDTARVARLENVVKLRQAELDTHRNYRKMLEDEQAKNSPASQADTKTPSTDWMADYKKIMSAIGGDDSVRKAAADAARLREEQARLVSELGGLSGSFAKDWGNLTLLFKSGALSITDLEQAQAKLLAKQPAIKEAADAEIKARQEVENATQAATAAHWKYLETLSQGLDKAKADVVAMEEQTARIGLSKEAIAALDAAKLDLMATDLERQAIRAYDKNLDDAEYATLMKTAAAYRGLGKAKVVNAQTETAVSEFTRVWDSIDRTAHDTFVNIFQGGQDAFTKLRDTLKATLLDLLYQMTVKKWIISIAASVSGAGVANAAIPGEGAGGGILNTIMGGLGSFGTGASYGFQSLFANGFGTTMSAGGQMLGAGSTMAGLGTMAGAVLPWLAGASILSNLMDYKVTPTGNALVANVGSGGASAVASRSDFRQEGGLFGGGVTNNSSWASADTSTAGYIDSSIKNVTAANMAYASALGLNADALKGYTTQLEINVTGMDAAAAQAAIDASVAKFQSEQISSAYGDALKSVARDGETSAQTMQRLATDLTGANQVMTMLGGTLYEVSTAGAAAASGLVSAMGGMAQFQSQMTAYYQSYYTQAEQKANIVNSAQSDLAAAGITGFSNEQISNASREQIRAVVDSFEANKNTAEGAKQYAAVVKVANSLSAVTPALNTMAEVSVAQVSGGGGGGGGSTKAVADGASAIAKAMQEGANSIWDEVKRIRGLMDVSGGAQGLADLQAQYAIATASARSGSAEAAKALPGIVQALLPLLDSAAITRQDMQWQRGQIAASLADTGSILSSQFGLSIPQFAVGTNYVPRDMLAMVHEGESIIPKAYNPAAGGGQDYSDLLAEMQGMRTELADARRALGKIATSNEQISNLALKSDTIGPAPARAVA